MALASGPRPHLARKDLIELRITALKRDLLRLMGGIILGGAATLALLSACSNLPDETTATPATPQPPAASQPAPAPEGSVTPVPAVPQNPPLSPTPPVGASDSDLLAKGALIYDKTAGGLGCASCHGVDGKGASAPYIRGASKAQVRQALSGGAPAMNFIKLSEDEITAVVAYLEYLRQQP